MLDTKNARGPYTPLIGRYWRTGGYEDLAKGVQEFIDQEQPATLVIGTYVNGGAAKFVLDALDGYELPGVAVYEKGWQAEEGGGGGYEILRRRRNDDDEDGEEPTKGIPPESYEDVRSPAEPHFSLAASREAALTEEQYQDLAAEIASLVNDQQVPFEIHTSHYTTKFICRLFF